MKTFFILLSFPAFLFLSGACAPLQLGEPENLNSGRFALPYIPDSEEQGERGRTNFINYKPFPMDSNRHVDKWLNYYSKTNKGRADMKDRLNRSTRYLGPMKTFFREQGLPTGLAYIAMVESGFRPNEISGAGAVGPWQFMDETADDYDLIRDRHIDERQDFYFSTQAAIRFLKDLYAKFGDWRLSMAAYNAGPGKVQRAIKRHGSRNYWYLVEREAIHPACILKYPECLLKKETRDFVPKIIAMRKIALRPEEYNF